MTESTCIFEYILCDDESDKIIMDLNKNILEVHSMFSVIK